MIHRGTYDGTIYHNPVNKFCIISVKTADKEVPQEARSTRRYRDHLIRFVATGYELPRTDAVELELDGEWTKGKYGVQLQVEQWREIVPKTKDGVEGYLASGLIKGIGPATAAQIVSRFGVETLDILQNHPERLLEVKGITESKLEDIKTSYAESRMLQDLMTLLSPFKITPKTALKIYQHFGPASVDILKKSPFELCQVSGFGFLRVDAIVQKNGGDLHDPMRVKGALFWALEDSKGGKGHLFLPGEALRKEALRLLNAKIPVPSLRLHEQEVADVLQDMILHGEVVSVKDNIYLPRTFAQEDETARRIAMRLIEPSAPERIEQALEQVKREMGLVLSSKQEAAVYAAYRHSLSIITGSPGTGKTTVLKTILEVYRRLHPKGEIVLMAPTGRASRRMAESTGFDKARTLHSGLGLGSEEDDANRNRKQEPLSADLIIVDEFSMVDMWLADKFFSRIKDGARVVLVGDPDQLPSVGAGNVFRELIDCGMIPVTVLDQIFRQSKDSLIAYNAKFINEGNTKLYFGPDFIFMASDNQAEAAERIIARYCREIAESGIDRVQILSPFRSEGAASAEQLNEAIREVVNPFRSAEEEIKIGVKVFRVNDRIMQTKNTAKVSNGDLGFIRYIKDDENGKRVGLDFGVGRELEYSVEDMVNLDLAYATTIHKAMGSEYETVIMPLLKAHTVMLYRKGFDDWQLALRRENQRRKEIDRLSFKAQYLRGLCELAHIEDCIELWQHLAENKTCLTEYLGLTREEHETFLRQGRDALGALLEPQRRKQRFVLYQLELDEQKAIPFAFKELAALQKAGYEQPPAAMYRMVGAGEVYCPVEQSDAEILKRLFADCREELPEGCHGRPMALSDVVELDHSPRRVYYYVNGEHEFPQVKFSPMLAKKDIKEGT